MNPHFASGVGLSLILICMNIMCHSISVLYFIITVSGCQQINLEVEAEMPVGAFACLLFDFLFFLSLFLYFLTSLNPFLLTL